MKQYNEHGFDETGFLQYMTGEETASKTEILSNIVEYAQRNNHVSLDQFAYAVSDMTGIPFEEVLPYCSDEILTTSSREIKETMMKPWGAEYEQGFAKDAFLQYADTYMEDKGDILKNALEELYKTENVSKDQLAQAVSEIAGCEFEDAAAFCDASLLTSYGQTQKHNPLSIYSTEIQQEENRVAKELIYFVQDHIGDTEALESEYYDGDDLQKDVAEQLEYTSDLNRFLNLLDPYSRVTSDRQWEVDRAIEAGELMTAICKLQQAQMEETQGETYTDAECLEIAVGRGTRGVQNTPMVQFGRYTVMNNTSGERNSTSTLMVDDVPTAILSIDWANQTAVLDFVAGEISPEEKKAIIEAYKEVDSSIRVAEHRGKEEQER